MAKILCIDTATGPCSVAVSIDGEVVSSLIIEDPYRHSEILNELVERSLKAVGLEFRELEAVALSAGPGSYTSLRVGTATAKAMCFALNIPLISIETLFALAEAMKGRISGDYYIPMIDARRMEIYTIIYDADLQLISEIESKILDESSFLELRERKVVFGGDGCGKLKDLGLSSKWEFLDVICSAENLAGLAEVYYKKNLFVSLLNFSPLYLKKPNITQSKREPF